jgi:hypothetical protein
LSKIFKKSSGWKVHREKYIKGFILVDILDSTNLTIYLMSYSQSGELIHKRNLGVMDSKYPI